MRSPCLVVARNLLFGSALLVACAEAPSPDVTPSARATPGTQASPTRLDTRADAFVAAWRRAKHHNGPPIDSYLAERVMVRYQHAPDEPRTEPRVLDRARAARTLTDAIEGFVIGRRQWCDARCCTFDTNYQRGDTMSAIASICFEGAAVTEVEARP